MRKRMAYAVSMLCVLAWLLCSNAIIASLSKAEPVRKIEFDERWRKDVGCGWLDEVKMTNSITGGAMVSGWAFVDTYEPNKNRHVSLILRGENGCYEMRMVPPENTGGWLHLRNDVKAIYSDRLIPDGTPLGFVSEFSILNVKDGFYKVYIYCWENEKNYALMEHEWWVEKHGVTMKMLDLPTDSSEQ